MHLMILKLELDLNAWKSLLSNGLKGYMYIFRRHESNMFAPE